MTDREDLYLAACCGISPGLSRAAVKRLLTYTGGAERLYNAGAELLRESGLCTPKQAAAFCAGRSQKFLEHIAAYLRGSGAFLLGYASPAYPRLLRETADAPLVLYVRGRLPESGLNIAVVGSRACTAYGARVARDFAYKLALQGVNIISGGARGIDSAAHQGALAAQGKTVAVLGCGLDQCYPPENAALFREIAGQGALISEYPPGAPPQPFNFPARNRIIAGLSHGVIVAEARAKSGALITARLACDENRDVYCVPGDIYGGASSGCHELIRQGAKLADDPRQILEDSKEQLQEQTSLWEAAEPELDANKQNMSSARTTEPLTPPAIPAALVKGSRGEQIWSLLGKESLSLAEIAESLDCSLDSLSVDLLELQLAGLIKESEPQVYSRI